MKRTTTPLRLSLLAFSLGCIGTLTGCSHNEASPATATPPATNRDQAMKTMPADIQAKVAAQQGRK